MHCLYCSLCCIQMDRLDSLSGRWMDSQ
ncbi:hypothetical protein BpHYR1_004178 [Brachionus plicatilis]|uniref:Uncharacterized protein n=1 Tax=Brachionus plicatilis TaxID=10195 RepID=A0A3M7QDY9_BRAPC|nr:hypothetical protein BpHYR1_004178 [Brachionus plicatilis]